jgi:hypothetical protein
VNVTCASAPDPTNTAPTVAADSDPVTVDEGDLATNTGTYEDADGDDVDLTASVGTVTDNEDGTWSWDFQTTDGPFQSQTVTITADDGTDTGSVDFGLTVNNVAPDVAAPSFSAVSIDCRSSVDLTGISFSDPGVNDADWNVNVDWDDGSTDVNYDTATQGAQDDQSHSYDTPGTYSATVDVTDKDNGLGSASSTVVVNQVYRVDFRPPFDDSSPSGLIVNKMKSGRTVPVKATIFDVCANSYVTDPAAVKIAVSKANVADGSSYDSLETYADAGSSSAGTNLFRWSADPSVAGGGFWIYNLDSRNAINGSPMVVGQVYRINIYVGTVLATGSDWALLMAVK